VKKLLLIYNPRAGKAKLRAQLAEIIEIFDRHDWRVSVRPTRKAKDATLFLTEEAEGFDRIVVSGGDGTLHEALSGLRNAAAEGKKVPPLGFLPTGSTNDFAKTLNIPTDPVPAAQIAAEGRVFPCDAGSFNGRPFTYVAAFGAFAKVSYATPQQIKNTLGHFAYILEGAKELSRIKGIRTRVETEDGIFEGDYLFGMVSNTTSVGGFDAFHSNLQVSLNDGLLEVVLVQEPKTLAEQSALLTDLMRINMKSRFFTVLKARNITFTFPEEMPPEWTLDGEFGGADNRVEIHVLPGAYAIVIPEEAHPLSPQE